MSALDGQVALVTGSSRGIGVAIAAEFASDEAAWIPAWSSTSPAAPYSSSSANSHPVIKKGTPLWP